MWIIRPVAFCITLAVVSEACAQPQPQFEAEVAGDNVYALAGPGNHYYPTARLYRDEKVIVYGERSGDWLAILPPKFKSCSYIRQSEVESQQNGSAVVKAPRADVRVGSDLPNNRANWVRQVWLNRGTPVDIIEAVDLPGKGEVEKWWRIIPPDEEVRYVAASDLRLPEGMRLPPEAAKPARPADEPPGQTRPSANSTPPQTVAVQPPKFFGPEGTIPPATPISGTRAAAQMRSATKEPSGFEFGGAGRGDEAARRLDEELARMATRLPSSWNLKDAQAALDGMKGSASPSAIASLQVRLDDLAARRRRFDEIQAQSEQSRQEFAALEAEARRVESRLTALKPQYDAVGVLRPAKLSITAVDGRQAYSLINDRGAVTHFVVPPLGLNMQQYVGKRIGLNGRKEARNGLPPLLWVEQVAPELDQTTPNVKTL